MDFFPVWISGTDCDLEEALKKEKFCFVFDQSDNKNFPQGCTFPAYNIDPIVFKVDLLIGSFFEFLQWNCHFKVTSLSWY